MFLKSKACFLGYNVDSDGIHMVDDKIFITRISRDPNPSKTCGLSLGCGYYRSFINGFQKLVSPLTQLLNKEVPFHWNVPQESSFTDLKAALINAPILAFPDNKHPFFMYMGITALGVGAVLMQLNARGKHRSVAYASRAVNQAEYNYSVTHQETLAVVWALRHFWDIILGYPITVFTDHAAVTELLIGRNLIDRLARWYLTILEFNPTFKYLPGRANVVADSLS